MPLGQLAVGALSGWFGTHDVQGGADAIVRVTFIVGAPRLSAPDPGRAKDLMSTPSRQLRGLTDHPDD
ncbi:MAG: hypothetical protein V9G15_16005 [Dermatophilaceae bacterium]